MITHLSTTARRSGLRAAPPDSHHSTGCCPRCGVVAAFTLVGTLPVTFDRGAAMLRQDGELEPSVVERVAVLKCMSCEQGTVAIEQEFAGDRPAREDRFAGVLHYRGFHWWPLPDVALSEDLPPAIRAVYADAAGTLAAGFPRASVAMARRTLEAITAHLGEEMGSLKSRIDALVAAGELPRSLGEWADEVRITGNIGAHYDPLSSVEVEDARALLRFLGDILYFAYEAPAEIRRRRAAR